MRDVLTGVVWGNACSLPRLRPGFGWVGVLVRQYVNGGEKVVQRREGYLVRFGLFLDLRWYYFTLHYLAGFWWGWR